MIAGNLLKLQSIHANPVEYRMPVGSEVLLLNQNLGKQFIFRFTGEINCISCGARTKTSFSQGFCYKCFTSLPETEEDVLHPEKCQAHLGIARDMEWARRNCLIDHHVYLSDTSQLKVGVTRIHQVPTRWIDQGASQVISLAVTPNRHLAGMIEVSLKAHIADKTQWKTMLMNNARTVDLLQMKQKIEALVPAEYQQYINPDNTIYEFSYPIIEQPQVKQSVNFDNKPVFEGKLIGIKGQYLLFDNGFVLNIRKYAGYKMEIQIMEPLKKTATLF